MISSETKYLFAYSLAIKILFVGVLYALNALIPINLSMTKDNFFFYATNSNFLNMFISWDSQWFLKVIESGYSTTATYAFYPYFPMMIRNIHQLLPFISPVAIGVIFNTTLSILSSLLLCQLLPSRYTKLKPALITLFLLNPAAIFYSSLYSESSFVFFSLLTLVLFKQKRFFFAGLAGIIACLSRSVGIILLVPILIQTIAQKSYVLKTAVTTILIILGTIIFPLISFKLSGDIQIYLKAHQLFNRSIPGIASVVKIGQLITSFNHLPVHTFFESRIEIVLLTLLIAVCIAMVISKFNYSLTFFAIALILVPLSSGSTMSLIRTSSVAFPIYLFIVQKCASKPLLLQLIILLSAFFAISFGLMYSHWYWVA